MAVVEITSVLLLNSESICVIIAGLDRVLCDSGYAVIPWSIDLIHTVPDILAAASSGLGKAYQCMVVSVAS